MYCNPAIVAPWKARIMYAYPERKVTDFELMCKAIYRNCLTVN